MEVLLAAWRRYRSLDPFVKDAAFAVALCLLALLVAALAHDRPWQTGLPAGWLALSLAPVVLVAWRRRYPLASYCVQLGALMLGVILTPRLVEAPWSVGAILLGAYSAGAFSRHRLASLLVTGGGSVVAMLVFFQGYGYSYLLLAFAWLIGNAIRAERRHAADLRERALCLAREEQAIARAAASDERARIARELHEVIAHSVSVMVVQAEAAWSLLPHRTERAGEAMAAVSEKGRQAQAELGHLLRLLGQEDGPPALSPPPGLAPEELEALVERMRAAGLMVELRLEGEPRDLPPGLALTAHRVVQEGLTSALKHAGRARVLVVVRYGDNDVDLEVLDDGERPIEETDGGRGLAGMRQRVALYGGDLEAGWRAGHGYAVRVRLPLEAQLRR